MFDGGAAVKSNGPGVASDTRAVGTIPGYGHACGEDSASPAAWRAACEPEL